jgi:hypothetical protein
LLGLSGESSRKRYYGFRDVRSFIKP